MARAGGGAGEAVSKASTAKAAKVAGSCWQLLLPIKVTKALLLLRRPPRKRRGALLLLLLLLLLLPRH
jgi:hypothetical protein